MIQKNTVALGRRFPSTDRAIVASDARTRPRQQLAPGGAGPTPFV